MRENRGAVSTQSALAAAGSAQSHAPKKWAALGVLACGLAGSAGVLIVARVVQGVGGAAILPSTLSSVNSLFQGDDRAAAFGVWGAVMAGAAAVGPLAGGLLTEYAGWRWIFWVNVPIGVLLFVLALKLVPNTKGRSDAGHDVAGFLLSAIGLALLQKS
ncbi:MFS transporter [Corynebacterium urealyticum]|uniref:MFS transporter n=1 Tax=Corynebacterium urealyticum TaxID=43771 RepID=UPI00292A4806|nr:MFS transporter [Corynebacterium urealyticum]